MKSSGKAENHGVHRELDTRCKWSVRKWKLERSSRVMFAMFGEKKGLGRRWGW